MAASLEALGLGYLRAAAPAVRSGPTGCRAESAESTRDAMGLCAAVARPDRKARRDLTLCRPRFACLFHPAQQPRPCPALSPLGSVSVSGESAFQEPPPAAQARLRAVPAAAAAAAAAPSAINEWQLLVPPTHTPASRDFAPPTSSPFPHLPRHLTFPGTTAIKYLWRIRGLQAALPSPPSTSSLATHPALACVPPRRAASGRAPAIIPSHLRTCAPQPPLTPPPVRRSCSAGRAREPGARISRRTRTPPSRPTPAAILPRLPAAIPSQSPAPRPSRRGTPPPPPPPPRGPSLPRPPVRPTRHGTPTSPPPPPGATASPRPAAQVSPRRV